MNISKPTEKAKELCRQPRGLGPHLAYWCTCSAALCCLWCFGASPQGQPSASCGCGGQAPVAAAWWAFSAAGVRAGQGDSSSPPPFHVHPHGQAPAEIHERLAGSLHWGLMGSTTAGVMDVWSAEKGTPLAQYHHPLVVSLPLGGPLASCCGRL